MTVFQKKSSFPGTVEKKSAQSVAILFYSSSQCTGDDNKVQSYIMNLHFSSDESSGLKL